MKCWCDVPNHPPPEGFVPLSEALRQPFQKQAEREERHAEIASREENAAAPCRSAIGLEVRSFAEEIALLRLRTIECFERARTRLLERFAEEVLARELRIQAPDISTIAKNLLAGFVSESPLTLVVAPEEVARLSADVPVRADASLSPGDVMVLFSDGGIESPLRFRAESIVAEISRDEALR